MFWQGGCKFILRARTGSTVKIYDSSVRPDSVYKCLLVAAQSTVADTLSVLLSCYPPATRPDPTTIALYEHSPSLSCERLLAPRELTLRVRERWAEQGGWRFVVRPTEERGGAVGGGGERGGFLRQSLRKAEFLRSMICTVSWSGGGQGGGVVRQPDSRSLGGSEESELNTSEEEGSEAGREGGWGGPGRELSSSCSSPDAGSVILDSFFT